MTEAERLTRAKRLQGLRLLLATEDGRERERDALHEKARAVGPGDDREAWLENTREVAEVFSEHAGVAAEISRLIGELAPSDGTPSPTDDEDYEDLRARLRRTPAAADDAGGEREAWEEAARRFAKTADGLRGIAEHARETSRLCG